MISTNSDVSIAWDYVIVSRYDIIQPECPRVEVQRRDERHAISEATFIAEYSDELEDVEGRAHVKIWLSGGLTSSLTKQFTGLITGIQRPRHGSIHRQFTFECKSYMTLISDREITKDFSQRGAGVTSAVISTIEDLIEESEITVRSVLFYTTQVEPKFERENSFEALQEIVNDERFPCSMFLAFDGDLNLFTYSTRKASQSLVQSDLIGYQRIDDYNPGTIQNSVTVYGNWTAFWPTSGIHIPEVAENSDLVESDILGVWSPGAGPYFIASVINPRVVGDLAMSIVYSDPLFTDQGVTVLRSFNPPIDGTEYSQFLFYWKWSGVNVSAIKVAVFTNWLVNGYSYVFGPTYSNVGWSQDKWGGDPYVNTEITVVPFGDKAIDEQGQPLYSQWGNPSWSHIAYVVIRWIFQNVTNYATGSLDGAYFGGFRWKGGAVDATSTQFYGSCVRSYEGKYLSNEQCTSAAEAIVGKYKDPPVRLDDCQIKPRTDLKPAEEIRLVCSELNERVVINEIDLVYDHATLDVTVNLGDIRPDYISYERNERQARRQMKELTDEYARRRREFYGYRTSGRYGPV